MALGLHAGPLKLLCLGARPDDVEIGRGGALLQLARRHGTTVRAVVLTGDERVVAEAAAALDPFVPGARLQPDELATDIERFGLSSEDFEGARSVRLENVNELIRLGRLGDLLTRGT